VAEVTNCKQASMDFRGHEEIYSEAGGVMDFDEDRVPPKRYLLRIHNKVFMLLDLPKDVEFGSDKFP